jgi:hypothetical protein
MDDDDATLLNQTASEPADFEPRDDKIVPSNVDPRVPPLRQMQPQISFEATSTIEASEGTGAGAAGSGVSPQTAAPISGKTKPDSPRTDTDELLPGFIIEVYALDRKGRRLEGYSRMAPGAKPPPLFRLRDGDLLMSALSGGKLGPDTDMNVLDTELEARLLSLGRPLPCQVALYGVTKWGKKPLQVAVADGTFDGLASMETFVDRYLLDSLVPRNGGGSPGSARPSFGTRTPQSEAAAAAAAGAAAAASEAPTSAREHMHPPPSLPDADMLDYSSIDNEDELLASISPQLTSLNFNGCAPTLRQLVAKGYLHELDRKSKQFLVRSTSYEGVQMPAPLNARSSVPPGSEAPHGKVEHQNFAIEVGGRVRSWVVQGSWVSVGGRGWWRIATP